MGDRQRLGYLDEKQSRNEQHINVPNIGGVSPKTLRLPMQVFDVERTVAPVKNRHDSHEERTEQPERGIQRKDDKMSRKQVGAGNRNRKTDDDLISAFK